MDAERISRLSQGGDEAAAQVLLRSSQRRGDPQGQIEAAFAILVNSSGTEDFVKAKEMFKLLFSLGAYEEAFCWFPDEVARLEKEALVSCPRCNGLGVEAAMFGGKKSCKKCHGNKYKGQNGEGFDELGEMASLLSQFEGKVEDRNSLIHLYFRCLVVWWPEHWQTWYEKAAYSISPELRNWFMYPDHTTVFYQKVRLVEAGPCICKGKGGCYFCKYCRSGISCERCYDSGKCSRCGKGEEKDE